MRILVALCVCLILNCSMAIAQSREEPKQSNDSDWSTGRTVLPENRGQLQPQGWTGPLDTEGGGAPATTPQGGTPPPMQPAPGGASKTIVDPSMSR